MEKETFKEFKVDALKQGNRGKVRGLTTNLRGFTREQLIELVTEVDYAMYSRLENEEYNELIEVAVDSMEERNF